MNHKIIKLFMNNADLQTKNTGKRYLRFYIYGFSYVWANAMVSMFMSMYLKSRDISEESIGGFIGAFNAVLPLVVLSFGLLSDRISCRKLVMLGSLISIIYCALMPSLDGMALMGIVILLGGVGRSLSIITANVLFLKTVDQHKRGKKLSIFVACMTSGYAVGSAMGSIMVRELSLPVYSVFYLALPLHLTAFIMASGLPEVPALKFPMIRYFHDMKRLPVFCLALITFSLGTHWGSEHFGTVRFLDEIIHARGFEMAFFFIGGGIFTALFTRTAGHLVDKKANFIKFLVIGMVISGATHALTGLTKTFGQFFIVRILHVCGDSFIVFGIPFLVSMAFPAGRMGGNYGFNRTINSIGTTAGSLVAGFVAGRFFLGMPFIVTGIIQVMTGGVILLMRQHIILQAPAPSPLKSS